MTNFDLFPWTSKGLLQRSLPRLVFPTGSLGCMRPKDQVPLIQVLQVHHPLADLPITSCGGVLKQVHQVLSTTPYHSQLHIRVPFQNIVKHITEAPWGSLGGECGQYLDIRHGTIALQVHTLRCKYCLGILAA